MQVRSREAVAYGYISVLQHPQAYVHAYSQPEASVAAGYKSSTPSGVPVSAASSSPQFVLLLSTCERLQDALKTLQARLRACC